MTAMRSDGGAAIEIGEASGSGDQMKTFHTSPTAGAAKLAPPARPGNAESQRAETAEPSTTQLARRREGGSPSNHFSLAWVARACSLQPTNQLGSIASPTSTTTSSTKERN
jgi:hypothetical protein